MDLFDIQVNGCSGVGFTDPTLTRDGIRTIVEWCRGRGVVGFCPTIITSSYQTIRHAFATLAAACESDATLATAMQAFHLEGPYISAEEGYRGAHPKLHARPPQASEFDRWQEAAGGRIKLVTLAPELDGAIPFIERLTAAGVVVALGHTAATGEQIRAAVDAGAKLSTHLGNGCPAMLPRHPNVIWEQLAEDRLSASVIADGHHLSASVLMSVIRAKTVDRVILISDAGTLAGMPAGRYQDWGTELEVLANGKIVLAETPYLAGSGAGLDDCVRHVLSLGVSVSDVRRMAWDNPRRLLGIGALAEWNMLESAVRRPGGGE